MSLAEATNRIKVGPARGIAGVIDKIVLISGGFSAAILLLVTFFTFTEIVARGIFGISIFYFIELAVFATVFFAFVGSAYCLKTGHHISVDLIITNFSVETKAIFNIILNLISMGLFAVFVWKGSEWAAMCFNQGVMQTSVIKMPSWIIISAIPVGGILLILQSLRLITSDINVLVRYKKSGRNIFSPRSWNSPSTALCLLIICFIIGALLIVYINLITGIVFFLLVFLFGGMPVSFALGTVGLLGLLIFFEGDTGKLMQVPISAFAKMDSFGVTALPLFILGGGLMSAGKVISGIFTVMERWAGRFTSSLMLAAIAACTVFSAVTGSSVGATATMSQVTLPELFKRGYKRSFACGVVAGATIGGLIPPSLALITYGIMTETSIARLFMSALLPGIVVEIMYMLYVVIRMHLTKEKIQLPETVTWKERFISLKDGFWGLFTPVLILGGIYIGWFTPTEVAAILVIYALIVGLLIMKSMKWRDLPGHCMKAVNTSLMILFIIIGSVVFGIFLSQTGIEKSIVEFAKDAGLTSGSVLILIFIVLTVLGFVMDGASILLITLPVFYPLAMSVGIEPYWFAVFYAITLEVGLMTPPVGLTLFVIRDVTGEPLSTIIHGTVPFMLILASLCLVIYWFPQLVYWIPSTM